MDPKIIMGIDLAKEDDLTSLVAATVSPTGRILLIDDLSGVVSYNDLMRGVQLLDESDISEYRRKYMEIFGSVDYTTTEKRIYDYMNVFPEEPIKEIKSHKEPKQKWSTRRGRFKQSQRRKK